MSIATTHIDKYNALNGKRLNQTAIGKVLFPLQKCIENAHICKSDPNAKHIEKIQNNLVKAYNAASTGSVKLEIAMISLDKPKTVKLKNPRKSITSTRSVSKTKNQKPSKPTNRKPVAKAKKESKAKAQTSGKQTTLFNGLSGFTPLNEKPEKPANMFTLPGNIGSWLGEQQRNRLVISLDGETHAGKSELAKQIVNAFATKGYNTAWYDLEQGGITSKDTLASFNRNVETANMPRIGVNGEAPNGIESIKEAARNPQIDVIAIDSATKLNINDNSWFEDIRNEFPDKIFIPIWQQNEQGGTRGGAAVQFDAPVHIKVYRPDHTTHEKNYATFLKNRGNATDQHYLVTQKKITIINPNENV